MATRIGRILTGVVLLMSAACATVPTGPSVMVLPAPGKTFEQFQVDDAVCRQWAGRQIGMQPQDIANQTAISGAAVGTVVGAAAGAAIGAATGDAGAGAAIGAGSGLLVGTASGADAGQAYGWEAQRRYDIAYQQCMYAKGNQIPGVTVTRTRQIQPPPPPAVHLGPGPTRPEIPPDYYRQ